MLTGLFKSKYFWIAAAFLVAVYLLAVRHYQAQMLAQQTGAKAGRDALSNGYTTYNTSLYKPPWWFPTLKFSKANPYVPVNEQPENYGGNGSKN